MSDNDKVKGAHGGREWSVSGPAPAGECYPKSDSYTWGEFAGVAVEMGGYNDISMVDPYTGRRFWLADAFRCDPHAQALRAAQPGADAIAAMKLSGGCRDCGSFYTALRRLIDAAEAAGFPDNYRGADGDEGPSNPHESGGVDGCESCTEIRQRLTP